MYIILRPFLPGNVFPIDMSGLSNILTYVLICAYLAAGASRELQEIGLQITALFQQVIDLLQSQPWNALG